MADLPIPQLDLPYPHYSHLIIIQQKTTTRIFLVTEMSQTLVITKQ